MDCNSFSISKITKKHSVTNERLPLRPIRNYPNRKKKILKEKIKDKKNSIPTHLVNQDKDLEKKNYGSRNLECITGMDHFVEEFRRKQKESPIKANDEILKKLVSRLIFRRNSKNHRSKNESKTSQGVKSAREHSMASKSRKKHFEKDRHKSLSERSKPFHKKKVNETVPEHRAETQHRNRGFNNSTNNHKRLSSSKSPLRSRERQRLAYNSSNVFQKTFFGDLACSSRKYPPPGIQCSSLTTPSGVQTGSESSFEHSFGSFYPTYQRMTRKNVCSQNNNQSDLEQHYNVNSMQGNYDDSQTDVSSNSKNSRKYSLKNKLSDSFVQTLNVHHNPRHFYKGCLDYINYNQNPPRQPNLTYRQEVARKYFQQPSNENCQSPSSCPCSRNMTHSPPGSLETDRVCPIRNCAMEKCPMYCVCNQNPYSEISPVYAQPISVVPKLEESVVECNSIEHETVGFYSYENPPTCRPVFNLPPQLNAIVPQGITTQCPCELKIICNDLTNLVEPVKDNTETTQCSPNPLSSEQVTNFENTVINKNSLGCRGTPLRVNTPSRLPQNIKVSENYIKKFCSTGNQSARSSTPKSKESQKCGNVVLQCPSNKCSFKCFMPQPVSKTSQASSKNKNCDGEDTPWQESDNTSRLTSMSKELISQSNQCSFNELFKKPQNEGCNKRKPSNNSDAPRSLQIRQTEIHRMQNQSDVEKIIWPQAKNTCQLINNCPNIKCEKGKLPTRKVNNVTECQAKHTIPPVAVFRKNPMDICPQVFCETNISNNDENRSPCPPCKPLCQSFEDPAPKQSCGYSPAVSNPCDLSGSYMIKNSSNDTFDNSAKTVEQKKKKEKCLVPMETFESKLSENKPKLSCQNKQEDISAKKNPFERWLHVQALGRNADSGTTSKPTTFLMPCNIRRYSDDEDACKDSFDRIVSETPSYHNQRYGSDCKKFEIKPTTLQFRISNSHEITSSSEHCGNYATVKSKKRIDCDRSSERGYKRSPERRKECGKPKDKNIENKDRSKRNKDERDRDLKETSSINKNNEDTRVNHSKEDSNGSCRDVKSEASSGEETKGKKIKNKSREFKNESEDRNSTPSKETNKTSNIETQSRSDRSTKSKLSSEKDYYREERKNSHKKSNDSKTMSNKESLAENISYKRFSSQHHKENQRSRSRKENSEGKLREVSSSEETNNKKKTVKSKEFKNEPTVRNSTESKERKKLETKNGRSCRSNNEKSYDQKMKNKKDKETCCCSPKNLLQNTGYKAFNAKICQENRINRGARYCMCSPQQTPEMDETFPTCIEGYSRQSVSPPADCFDNQNHKRDVLGGTLRTPKDCKGPNLTTIPWKTPLDEISGKPRLQKQQATSTEAKDVGSADRNANPACSGQQQFPISIRSAFQRCARQEEVDTSNLKLSGKKFLDKWTEQGFIHKLYKPKCMPNIEYIKLKNDCLCCKSTNSEHSRKGNKSKKDRLKTLDEDDRSTKDSRPPSQSSTRTRKSPRGTTRNSRMSREFKATSDERLDSQMNEPDSENVINTDSYPSSMQNSRSKTSNKHISKTYSDESLNYANTDESFPILENLSRISS